MRPDEEYVLTNGKCGEANAILRECAYANAKLGNEHGPAVRRPRYTVEAHRDLEAVPGKC